MISAPTSPARTQDAPPPSSPRGTAATPTTASSNVNHRVALPTMLLDRVPQRSGPSNHRLRLLVVGIIACVLVRESPPPFWHTASFPRRLEMLERTPCFNPNSQVKTPRGLQQQQASWPWHHLRQ